MSIKETLEKAKAELIRRGPTIADLADAKYDDEKMEYVDLDSCPVCALGALGAAYYGNPLKGEDLDDHEYRGAVATLAAAILGREPMFVEGTIVHWFDEEIHGDLAQAAEMFDRAIASVS